MFGNTAAIARAVADGIGGARPDAVVECGSVDEAPLVPADVDLVVLGAPTHFWGLTSSLTRRAEDQYERRMMRPQENSHGTTRRAAATTGMRTFLSVLPPGNGRSAATFDTRMTGRVTGGARRAVARSLHDAGYRAIAPPETFLVEAVAGPLRHGEVARARAWGAALVRALERPDTHPRRLTMQAVHDNPPAYDGSDTAALRSEATKPTTRRRAVDVVRVLTTTEVVVGAVLVARYLSRRPGAARARVTMGPGGWVSMKGGTVAVRRGGTPWARPRRIQPVAPDHRAPLWARVLSAVPLQALTR